MPRSETTVRNANLRHPVTVISDRPDLEPLGAAGARLKLDELLLAPEGVTEEQLAELRPHERDVLRKMAAEPDPAWGVPHQTAAIGALGQGRDRESLLQLAEQVRDGSNDDRVRIAAVNALGRIGGPQVATVLRELLEVPVPEVRAQAAMGLAQVGGSRDFAAVEAVAERDGTMAGDVARRAAGILAARLGLES